MPLSWPYVLPLSRLIAVSGTLSVLRAQREDALEIPFGHRRLNYCLASLFWAQPGSLFGAVRGNWSWLHRYGTPDIWLIYVSLYWEGERHEVEQTYGTTVEPLITNTLINGHLQ
jgi:hypothetical protein